MHAKQIFTYTFKGGACINIRAGLCLNKNASLIETFRRSDTDIRVTGSLSYADMRAVRLKTGL